MNITEALNRPQQHISMQYVARYIIPYIHSYYTLNAGIIPSLRYIIYITPTCLVLCSHPCTFTLVYTIQIIFGSSLVCIVYRTVSVCGSVVWMFVVLAVFGLWYTGFTNHTTDIVHL